MKKTLLKIVKEGSVFDLKPCDEKKVSKLTTEYIFSSLTNTSESVKKIGIFPTQPYIDEIVTVLEDWIKKKKFPKEFQKMYLLNDEPKYYESLNNTPTNLLLKFNETKGEKEMTLFLKALGVRGILTCLGMRKTEGSVNYFLPSVEQLISAFNTPFRKEPKITCGAVALSKHCVRNREDEFWGGIQIKGNQAAKSKKAVEVLMKVFEDTRWINVHLLPHQIPCFEIRVDKGYGARWVFTNYKDGVILDNEVEFRGFLEPQMKDGHEKGWVH